MTGRRAVQNVDGVASRGGDGQVDREDFANTERLARST